MYHTRREHLIPSSYSYQDPFDDYKTRLAKKLARRAESGSSAAKQTEKKAGDEINWFGIKVGSGHVGSQSGSIETGIGRYLGVKRPHVEQVSKSDIPDSALVECKKRRIGFGNFDNW